MQTKDKVLYNAHAWRKGVSKLLLFSPEGKANPTSPTTYTPSAFFFPRLKKLVFFLNFLFVFFFAIFSYKKKVPHQTEEKKRDEMKIGLHKCPPVSLERLGKRKSCKLQIDIMGCSLF